MRRLWWGVAAGGFAVFAVLAMRNNLGQGIGLCILAAVIVGAAIFYDRSLRRWKP